MGPICSSMARVARCFCLSSKGKINTNGNPSEQHANPEARRKVGKGTTTTGSPKTSESDKTETCGEQSPTTTNRCVGPHMTNSEGIDHEENFKVEWTSGARKETTIIKWKLKDFPALCELKELLRNETLVFSAGQSVSTSTRWCFNLQKMKNENNIGLFLKRLKPLALDEDDEEYQNRNRNSTPRSSPAVVPVAVTGNSQANGNPSRSVYDEDNAVEDVYIHYECIIKRSGFGETWLHKRTCIPNFEIGQRLGFRKLFTLEDMRETDAQNSSAKAVPLLSEDNTLNLEIKFNIHMRSFGKTKSEMNLLDRMSQENFEKFHAQLLSEEFGNLLESGNNSDLILIMEVDDKTFSVHRGILAARSAVFAAMLNSGMKESRTGVVRIKDVTSKAMENILCYVYTGNSNIRTNWSDVAEVQDLIYAADKYSLRGLKDLCDLLMYSGCKKDNAMELLYLAQAHNLSLAVKKISMFIKRNVDDVLCPNTRS